MEIIESDFSILIFAECHRDSGDQTKTRTMMKRASRAQQAMAEMASLAVWPAGRQRGDRIASDVRFWPKADMSCCNAHVRFRG